MNDLREEEAGLEQTALTLMRRHDRTAYRHAGVELVRVPGEEKLRVRTARERTATAETPEDKDEDQGGMILPSPGDDIIEGDPDTLSESEIH